MLPSAPSTYGDGAEGGGSHGGAGARGGSGEAAPLLPQLLPKKPDRQLHVPSPVGPSLQLRVVGGMQSHAERQSLPKKPAGQLEGSGGEGEGGGGDGAGGGDDGTGGGSDGAGQSVRKVSDELIKGSAPHVHPPLHCRLLLAALRQGLNAPVASHFQTTCLFFPQFWPASANALSPIECKLAGSSM